MPFFPAAMWPARSAPSPPRVPWPPSGLAPGSYAAGVRTRRIFTGLLVTVLGLAGCGDAPDTASIPPSSTGWVLFQQPDKTVELVAARPHGTMVNLSRRLGATGPAALSLNG